MNSSRQTLQDGDSLTDGEQLFLRRRREGWNQAQAAAHMQVTIDQYRLKEHDELKIDSPLWPEPTGAEKCVIYRRRAGMTQKDVAAAIGRSRLWVNRMERGLEDATPLVCFWES